MNNRIRHSELTGKSYVDRSAYLNSCVADGNIISDWREAFHYIFHYEETSSQFFLLKSLFTKLPAMKPLSKGKVAQLIETSLGESKSPGVFMVMVRALLQLEGSITVIWSNVDRCFNSFIKKISFYETEINKLEGQPLSKYSFLEEVDMIIEVLPRMILKTKERLDSHHL